MLWGGLYPRRLHTAQSGLSCRVVVDGARTIVVAGVNSRHFEHGEGRLLGMIIACRIHSLVAGIEKVRLRLLKPNARHILRRFTKPSRTALRSVPHFSPSHRPINLTCSLENSTRGTLCVPS